MKSINIDKLNLALLTISFVLACFLPFELFLFGYAFLGPIHYLTETNWIRDKNYFVVNSNWKFIVLIAALIYSIPFVFSLPFFAEYLNASIIHFLTFELVQYTNAILFFILISAILSVYYKTYKALIISFFIALFISFWLYKTATYILVVGLLLPTIIHVYLFTILFMIYGVKKSKSTFGKINVFLIILLPFSLLILDTDLFNYSFSPVVKHHYINNNFHSLNANLAKLLGVYSDLKFFFYEKVDLRIQIFITFAYIYHYLNWFSKTTIIGWHKQLTTKKALVIGLIWLLIIACYLYNFRLGLILSLFLSITHVMLEFPLNVITIKSLFGTKK
jgi:hypothetical protein